jgi:hypothetical protein
MEAETGTRCKSLEYGLRVLMLLREDMFPFPGENCGLDFAAAV